MGDVAPVTIRYFRRYDRYAYDSEARGDVWCGGDCGCGAHGWYRVCRPAAGHTVRYTLSVGGPASFDLFYLVNQPANKAAYNADAYSFVKRETVTVSPDALRGCSRPTG